MGHQELTRRFAAADPHAQGWTDPARRAARGGARRFLWSGQSRTRWQAAGGVNCRQSAIPATAGGGRPPRGGAHLRFYAVDIGRSPDGNWWVLRDRTQAPSGSGYALENRLALSRALPDVYRNRARYRCARREPAAGWKHGRCLGPLRDAGARDHAA